MLLQVLNCAAADFGYFLNYLKTGIILYNNSYKEYHILIVSYTISLLKITRYFEYLQNQNCSTDVNWQLVREDPTVHAWTDTLSLIYLTVIERSCVSVAFILAKQVDSSHLVQVFFFFFAKLHITLVWQTRFFSKQKSSLKHGGWWSSWWWSQKSILLTFLKDGNDVGISIWGPMGSTLKKVKSWVGSFLS